MEAVLFEQISAANGSEVGVIVLNQPKWLNGLSLEMARAITRQLALWRDDDRVRVVLLRGQGEKAFCAGGDLQSFYRHIPEPGMPIWSSEYLRTFFRDEYILDYMIHTYPKPIVCWANGYVMGGGAGLMMGCSHRVATETTRFAMPEISIGVVPDVGASWFLNRMPEFFGRLLGMTGMSINAADTLFLGLAQYVAHSSQWDQLLHDVQAESWGMHREVNDVLLEQVIRRLTFEDIPDGMMQRSAKAIQSACSGPDFFTIYGNILRWELGDEEVLGQAAQRMKAGSPGSVRLTFELLKKGRFLSLPDAFRLEYIAALNCAGNPDLKEGIRALLIDKDRSPAWMPATINEADAGFVARYFEPPWPPGEAHPLASLGAG
ncbi:enoyl-CoA hydratase/isomerase family protein [Pusillimonas sp. DMV24BSW_D]|uniref:enoyl-CoA hydratase/isomerase family protein n=1 Tax=Neopusillimonas aestuarii TaxID=2716226 RepID=UPI00140AD466|nr:enoyl-CoA hydratase/isomerase family protein [Pusillimonas sp. DMV24BSW_D]QIM49628.1 enoyl-CoA hydratase/isomerase family protein [Pusillimonas sp. DMV24BSW_D]